MTSYLFNRAEFIKDRYFTIGTTVNCIEYDDAIDYYKLEFRRLSDFKSITLYLYDSEGGVGDFNTFCLASSGSNKCFLSSDRVEKIDITNAVTVAEMLKLCNLSKLTANIFDDVVITNGYNYDFDLEKYRFISEGSYKCAHRFIVIFKKFNKVLYLVKNIESEKIHINDAIITDDINALGLNISDIFIENNCLWLRFDSYHTFYLSINFSDFSVSFGKVISEMKVITELKSMSWLMMNGVHDAR